MARVVKRELHDLGDRHPGDVGDGMARNVQADSVDQNESGHRRGPQQGELGGDPAADRVSDHGDIGEREVVEKRRIDTGEAPNLAQVVRPLGPGEAGVDRGENARRARLGE